MENKIIKQHFWKVGSNGDTTLSVNDLGWPEELVADARSDYSEEIFRYAIEIAGFNLLFYWTVDEEFYVIETEKNPIEVRRIYHNPHWDGVCEFCKADSDYGPNTASKGEIIALFENTAEIWNKLHINNVPIKDVLEKSLIMTWD